MQYGNHTFNCTVYVKTLLLLLLFFSVYNKSWSLSSCWKRRGMLHITL